MTVGEHNDLLHYYYGKKLADREYKAIAMKDENQCAFLPEGYTLENYRQEYPYVNYILFIRTISILF